MTSDMGQEGDAFRLPVQPARIRDAVLSELTALEGFVAGLSLDDWEKPSAVPAWSIGDVVAHLNLALGLYGRIIDAAVAGRGAGRAWKAFGDLTKRARPIGSPIFNTINSAIPRVIGGALAPETVKGQFAAGCRNLRQRVERVGSDDYTRAVYYMGSPWPLSFFLAAVLNELAVHGWDMSSRLSPDAHLSEAARSVLPAFYWGATSYMFHRPEGFRGTIQVVLSDPPDEIWWYITDGEIRVRTGQATDADVTIRGQSGTFVLVLAGRIGADDALRATSLTAAPDVEKARAFLSAWKIV